MSNCYDHSIKKNMLSTVYGSKKDLKKDILKNYQELQKWYEEQCELYKLPGRRIMKRIKHNDLTHYFIREHSTLPAGYLRSCEKFFKSIKQQALTPDPRNDRIDSRKDKL